MSISERRIELDSGVVGILADPPTLPPVGSRRIVFILHGFGGHKDYIYQKHVGQALPQRTDISTFRFDFRGCGDSADVPNMNVEGRTITGHDQEDLDSLYEYFKKDYELLGMIGHSRGSNAMFWWTLHHPDIFVPYLVNCSGRFVMDAFLKNISKRYPTYHQDAGYLYKAKRHGKLVDLWSPRAEQEEFAGIDNKPMANINAKTQVLTVFGTLDHIVPVADGAIWANMFKERGTLKLVQNADHNFKGVENGKKVDYNDEVTDIICQWFSETEQLQRWLQANKSIPSHARWPQVDQFPNLRDFGGYGDIKAGILFRSAFPEAVTAKALEQLKELNIRKVFDLRSDPEVRKRAPLKLAGIDVERAPVFATQDMSPIQLVERSKVLGDENSGFLGTYMDTFESLASNGAMKSIVEWLAEHPHQGMIVHCTAGKDRTGQVCAVILMALGIDNYTIAREYEMTNIGYGKQLKKLIDGLAAKLASQNVPYEHVATMLECSFTTIFTALQLFYKRYGTADRYLVEKCGLSTDTVERFRGNLLKKESRI